MTSPDLARTHLRFPWQVGEAVRLGWLEYLAENPLTTLLGAMIPRGVMQIVFFTLFEGVLGGPGRQYAFAGALALALTWTNIRVADVPLTDKSSATFWRIRIGDLPPAAALAARALPYPVMGLALLIIEAAIAAVIMGTERTAIDLIPSLWIYALMSFSLAMAGLAWAALTISKRADVLAPNILAYLVLLCSGAILPVDRIRWIGVIGSLLPVQHGLAAVQAALANRPQPDEAGWELVVGLAYTAGIALVMVLQTHRASRQGFDDFA